MKKVLSVSSWILGSLIFLTVALMVAAQTPRFQTWMMQRALSRIEKSLGGTIQVGSVSVTPLDAIVLRDVVVLDNEPYHYKDWPVVDTIFRAKYLGASFSLKGLFKKEGLHLSRVDVRDAVFSLVTDPRGNNITRLINAAPKKDTTQMGNIFDATRASLTNVRYVMLNYNSMENLDKRGEVRDTSTNHIRWDDMDVLVRKIKARDIVLGQGYMSGEVTEASLREKSGYELRNIFGKTRVGHGKTLVWDAEIHDLWSDIYLDEYSMSYENPKAFSNYIDSVSMTGQLHDSHVDMMSISYFAPSLRSFNIVCRIDRARVDGPVAHMDISDFKFTELNTGLEGDASCVLSGLPDVNRFNIDSDFRSLRFKSGTIGDFVRAWAPKVTLDLGGIAPDELFTFRGSTRGTLNDFKVRGTLASNVGSVRFDGLLKDIIRKGAPMVVKADVDAEDVDVKKLSSVEAAGKCSAKADFTLTLTPGSPQVEIDSAIVSKAEFLGYRYTGIFANGVLKNDQFDGRIVCSDPNLNFIFQGIFNLSSRNQNAVYKFYAMLGYADLNALNIDRRGVSKFSGAMINADYLRVRRGDLIGNVSITGLNFEDPSGHHSVGPVSVSSHSNDNIHRINLTSNFLEGTYIGTKPIGSLVKSIQEASTMRELPSLYKNGVAAYDSEEYDFSFNFHDSRDILSFVHPGLYVADSTSVKFSLKKNGSLTGTLKSRRLAIGDKYIKDVNLKLDNKDDGLNAVMSSSEMNISSMRFRNNSFILYAEDDSFGLGYTFDNKTDKTNRGEFTLSGNISRDDAGDLVLTAQTYPSSLYYQGKQWKVARSQMMLHNRRFSILEKLGASCGDQKVTLCGGFSKERSDTLKLNLENFDVSTLNNLLGGTYDIGGKATGRAFLTSQEDRDLGLLVNIRCDSTRFGGVDVGTLRLASAWEEGDNRFDVILRNSLGGKKTIDGKVRFWPETSAVKGNLKLDGAALGYAMPFLTSVFSEGSGSLEGEIGIGGTLKAPKFSSEGLKVSGARLCLDYTGVPYYADGALELTPGALKFKNIHLHDRYDGTGTLTGEVSLENMSDLGLNLHVDFRDMEGIDLEEYQNPDFYGNVFASGHAAVTGSLSHILIDVDATTTGDGQFHLPISGAAAGGSSKLLTFTQKEKVVWVDPYEEMMKKIKTKSSSRNDIAVKLDINATDDVEALLEVDKASGNVLTGRGHGRIQLDIRPSESVFNINGDYNITGGSYNFNAMNLARRLFTIQDGSSVRFNGAVPETDLNIKALYTTKTSLGTLIADTTSVQTRRNVECQIAISDKLKDPRVNFAINIPDLDPTTKSQVESALNTEDKIQKQFIYLLVTGNFFPDEQSGITNNNNILFSNVSQIMSSQLNNIMQKLDIPLDLGLNYSQNEQSGNNIFDVAVSTALFNNRVIVNGNVGNREYTSSGTEMVGNLDIDVKLNKSGQFRLNLFSHSADDYTNYLDNSQRNGVGVTYQREFNTFKEMIQSIFISRKKREAAARTLPPVKKKTIIIE